MWTEQSHVDTIVDNHGIDLREYLTRLIGRESTIKWALVESSPGDYGWAGDWIVNGVPCFLVLLRKESEVFDEKKGRGRKKRKAFRWLDTCYIWCCGNDDLFMMKRNIQMYDALVLFDMTTTDGVSRKELEDIGLDYG